MKITDVKIQNIKPYHDNPRVNNDAIDVVKKSLEEFGFQQPLVLDKDNVIIVGHTRFEAAKKLGIKKVPVQIANLNKNQAKAYRIADNRLNEDAKWDNELLNFEISNLIENNYGIDSIGFESVELENILKNTEEKDLEENFKEIDSELETSKTCPKCGFEFD